MSASAQQFKVTATGKVNSVSDSAHLYDSSVTGETPFTFSFLFDYSSPNLSSNTNVGNYRASGVNSGVTTTYGNYKLSPGSASISQVAVINSDSQNDLVVLSSDDLTATGFSVPLGTNHTTLQLYFPAITLSSGALPPLSAYDFSRFAGKSGTGGDFSSSVSGNGIFASSVSGSITSLSAELVNPAPVPEASTTVSLGVMLGLGGLALAVRARRRSRA